MTITSEIAKCTHTIKVLEDRWRAAKGNKALWDKTLPPDDLARNHRFCENIIAQVKELKRKRKALEAKNG